MATRRLEAAAPANEKQVFAAFFLHQFRASRSIDVGVSVSYPCKVIPLSDEDGHWDKKKVKTKRQVSPWKMGKIHGNQNRLAELHGSILRCLGPTTVQDSRGFQVQLRILLHSTMYTTNRRAGHLVSASLLKMHGRHYFSPQQNGAKNHWVAWQCTFKKPGRSTQNFLCHHD